MQRYLLLPAGHVAGRHGEQERPGVAVDELDDRAELLAAEDPPKGHVVDFLLAAGQDVREELPQLWRVGR